ncbi:unnamed protein product [Trichogramma brassicae]|uniref:Uncharacterized protein n=1 Tax=Trichogramma brassicae TaxID=86971 RepID=A0A6H5IWK4_9HYME|nr:unnamed protein product [Trichogramma brassicae]
MLSRAYKLSPQGVKRSFTGGPLWSRGICDLKRQRKGPLDQTKHRELQYWVPGDPKKILEQIHDPDLKSSPCREFPECPAEVYVRADIGALRFSRNYICAAGVGRKILCARIRATFSSKGRDQPRGAHRRH